MKNLIIYPLFILILLLNGCSLFYDDIAEPRMGIYEVIPVIVGGYNGYDGQRIYEYSNERDILICISDENAVIKHKSGEDLEFAITTSSGENEVFELDGEDIICFDYGGNTTPYHFFKCIYPKSYSTSTPDNEIIEINNDIDTIYFQYKSASFPRKIITDTLLCRSTLLSD
ncbi:MAG: hypothetical protein U9Q91_03700 [Candidatus Marinimicrobia bacterium]|nr:hypothetical protein [Candidatus Neomarinimicrobiota bacterium]